MHKPYLIYAHIDILPATSIEGCKEVVKQYGLRAGQYEIKPTGRYDGSWQQIGLYVDYAAKLKRTKHSIHGVKGYPDALSPACYKRLPHKELYYGA